MAARVVGVRAPGSLGIARYSARLSDALAELGVDYPLAAEPPAGAAAHLHVGNSSRRALAFAVRHRAPFVLTAHDIRARAKVLRPGQRWALGQAVKRARRVIVHSRVAADMLLADTGLDVSRIAVIPHAAPVPACADRADARLALGWSDGPPLAVLPGVIKRAKLVREAVEAAAPLIAAGRWRLALVGRVQDPAAARAARAAGVLLLEQPGPEDYERAIVAADLVLVLRAESVGETNGPLLDAIGAGRAIVVTATGSIPEVAGAAALFCAPSTVQLRRALDELSDPAARAAREAAAVERAARLTWAGAASAHRDLFAAVGLV